MQPPTRRLKPALLLPFIAAVTVALSILTAHIHHQNTPPWQRHLQAKLNTLEQINRIRQSHGLSQLALGQNNAAQMHAQDMLRHCYTSHWNLLGHPPHHRHSLHGGTQPNAENIFSDNECGYPDTPSQKNPGHSVMAIQALTAFLNSPGHRSTMLDPQHTHVSIGLAQDANVHKAVHHYHSHRATPVNPTTFDENSIAIDLRLHPELHGLKPSQVYLSVEHQPPPSPQETGTLRLTSCYHHGTLLAIAMPLKSGTQPVTIHNPAEIQCPTPAELSPQPPSDSAGELARYHRRSPGPDTRPATLTVKVLQPATWQFQDGRFAIALDHRPATRSAGPGLYTLTLAATSHPHAPGHLQLYQQTFLRPSTTEQ